MKRYRVRIWVGPCEASRLRTPFALWNNASVIVGTEHVSFTVLANSEEEAIKGIRAGTHPFGLNTGLNNLDFRHSFGDSIRKEETPLGMEDEETL